MYNIYTIPINFFHVNVSPKLYIGISIYKKSDTSKTLDTQGKTTPKHNKKEKKNTMKKYVKRNHYRPNKKIIEKQMTAKMATMHTKKKEKNELTEEQKENIKAWINTAEEVTYNDICAMTGRKPNKGKSKQTFMNMLYRHYIISETNTKPIRYTFKAEIDSISFKENSNDYFTVCKRFLGDKQESFITSLTQMSRTVGITGAKLYGQDNAVKAITQKLLNQMKNDGLLDYTECFRVNTQNGWETIEKNSKEEKALIEYYAETKADIPQDLRYNEFTKTLYKELTQHIRTVNPQWTDLRKMILIYPKNITEIPNPTENTVKKYQQELFYVTSITDNTKHCIECLGRD